MSGCRRLERSGAEGGSGPGSGIDGNARAVGMGNVSCGCRCEAVDVLGVAASEFAKSCAVGFVRRPSRIDCLTSPRNCSISTRPISLNPSSKVFTCTLTLFHVRAEHFQRCRRDGIKSCYHESRRNTPQQLTLSEDRILRREFDMW